MKGRWEVGVAAAKWACSGVVAKRLIVGVSLAVVAAAGCNDYGNTFQSPTGGIIDTLSPSTIPAGSSSFTLNVSGRGFVKETKVQWNGGTIPTDVQLNAAGQVTGITATVPASLVATEGTAQINTLSPHSGAGTNGLSNTVAFVIGPKPNPIPTLASLSPTQAPTGCSQFNLTITGTNFVSNSQAKWLFGGTTTLLQVRSANATQVVATVPSTLLSTPGTALITVFNPPSSSSGSGGGGTSRESLPFTVGTGTCPPAASTRVASATTVTAAHTAGPAEQTPAVSLDGRYVAYAAVQGEFMQVFVRDTCLGATDGCQPRALLVSAAADGAAANADSGSPSMNADGRYVAFSSSATNLISGAPEGRQVYLRDTCLGVTTAGCVASTTLISTDVDGALVGTESILPSASASGRFVAFVVVTPSSAAANLDPTQTKPDASGTSAGSRQVFVRDTCLGAANCTPKTTRISIQPGEGIGTSEAKPALSGSANRVALAGATTLFTPSVAVDDRIFLAATGNQQ